MSVCADFCFFLFFCFVLFFVFVLFLFCFVFLLLFFFGGGVVYFVLFSHCSFLSVCV